MKFATALLSIPAVILTVPVGAQESLPTKTQTQKYILQALHDIRDDCKYEIKVNKGTLCLVVFLPDKSDESWIGGFQDIIPLNGDAEFYVIENPDSDMDGNLKFDLFAREVPDAKKGIISTRVCTLTKDFNGAWHKVNEVEKIDIRGKTIIVAGNNAKRLEKIKMALDHYIA